MDIYSIYTTVSNLSSSEHPYIVYIVYVLIILATLALNIAAHSLLKQRWNLDLGFKLPSVFLSVLTLILGAPIYFFSDFMTAYYPAGRLVIENPSGLYNLQVVFVNIPIIAFLFTPFSLLRRRFALLLLIAVTFVIAIASYYLLIKLARIVGWQRIALFCLLAINGPLLYSFKEGNSTHFIFPLLVVGLLSLRSKREVWAGILFGVCTLIKPLFALIFIYLFARQRWSAAIGFVASVLAISGASLLLFGIDVHKAWFEFCILPYVGKVMPAFNNQSLDAFLARLMSDVSLVTWWPPIELGWQFKLVRYIFISILLGSIVWVFWKAKQPATIGEENLEMSIILCLAVLISPVSWTHYYLYFLIPISLYLGNQLPIPQGKWWIIPIILSIFLVSLPSVHIDLNSWILRFFISYYFLGGLVLLVTLLTARWHVARNPDASYSDLGLSVSNLMKRKPA